MEKFGIPIIEVRGAGEINNRTLVTAGSKHFSSVTYFYRGAYHYFFSFCEFMRFVPLWLLSMSLCPCEDQKHLENFLLFVIFSFSCPILDLPESNFFCSQCSNNLSVDKLPLQLDLL